MNWCPIWGYVLAGKATMIDTITWENAHTYGDVLPAMLRLRHHVFVQRRGYTVPTHRGMEWDQFDNACRRIPLLA